MIQKQSFFNFLILAVCGFIFLPQGAFAIDEASHSVVESPDRSELAEDLIKTNKAISNWFDSVAEGVDLFLVGKKVTSRRNDSKIIVENTTYSRESENFLNVTSISVNPRFPNLEAYWNLKFSTYDDQNSNTRTERGYARGRPREQNYAATIGLFRKMRDVRVAFEPRIELQDPLKVSHSISFESVIDFKKYEINPKFQLFAHATKGTGTFQAMNLNFHLTDIYSLTFINEGEYEEKLHRLTVNNAVSLGQVISDTSALAYGVSFISNNRPNYHLDAYSWSVSWSQVIYRRILDYQVTPHLDFTREEDFRGFVGLVFSLNVHF